MIRDRARNNSTAHRGKDQGVSEIIGDILILGITVVLFTSIFFYVNAIPTPSAQTFADFQATVTQPVANGVTFQEILNVTHLGGQSLNAGTTSIVVQVNQTTAVYTLPEGNSVGSSGILVPWTSSSWGTNQVWSVNQTGISAGSVVAISIINTASNYVVWSTVLTGKSGVSAPVIQSAYASPSPVTPGKKVTVYAIILGDVAYANASVFYLNGSVANLQLTPSAGLYTGVFQTSANLTSGQYYPIQINATSSKGLKANYTFSTLVENNGPDIITASINPNPATPGSYFNVTAYIIDENSTQFDPAAGLGSVTIQPDGTPLLTNITQNGSNAARMLPSEYTGIFTYPGYVELNTYGFETFAINATDTQGNVATYFITLVVLNTLNPGFLNSSYPSTYLGPTSMTFSNFKWYPAGSPQKAVTGYSVSLSEVANGIYFQLELTNHNTSNTLYLDDLTNIYFFAGSSVGFSQSWSFVVLNGTHGATYMTPYTNAAGYLQNNYSGSSETYPSLKWPLPTTGTPASNWANYTITGSSPSSTGFIVLPAAVGGVQVGVPVIFGAPVVGNPSSNTIPSTSGGPFAFKLTGNTAPFISTNFVELFGYLLPYQTMPWQTFPTGGIPYGQTIPFSGIYWY